MKKTANYIAKHTPGAIKKIVPGFIKERINRYIHRADGSAGEGGIDLPGYEKKWQEQFGERLEDYFKMHKQRYYELLRSFDYYIKDKQEPLVLEIGVSEFAIFYKHYFNAEPKRTQSCAELLLRNG